MTIDIAELRRAAATIEGVAERTPVLTDPMFDPPGGSTFHKLEAAQRAGSFKFRGAFNRLSNIPIGERTNGVVAVSSGNHGAAVACAASVLGVTATVFIPEDAPAVKRDLIEEFGATVVTFDRSVPDREAAPRAHASRVGATFVHPYEDPLVQAGQGTAALELFDEVGPLDALLVPMSGGGLMAGCASAAHAVAPGCRMIGVEPEVADDTRRSLLAGERIAIANPPTIADGLAVTIPGERTFEINRRLVSEVVTVSESEIVAAMRRFSEVFDRRIEPSGAVGVAALAALIGADPGGWLGRRVGVIISGGNIDDQRFDELIGRSLTDDEQRRLPGAQL